MSRVGEMLAISSSNIKCCAMIERVEESKGIATVFINASTIDEITFKILRSAFITSDFLLKYSPPI